MRQVPRRCTANCCSPMVGAHFCLAPAASSSSRARWLSQLGKLEVVRMIFVGENKERAEPQASSVGIERKLLFSTGSEVPWPNSSMVRVKLLANVS